MNKIIAVVVTYNRKNILKENIEALLNLSFNNSYELKILIVDNNSTDGTKEYINDYIKSNSIIYINTGANLGGAGGFNCGMKEAYKIGCDFMWLMDDDCIVHENSLQELLNADNILNGNYGFLSSKVLWKNGEICKMNIQKKTFLKWLKTFDKPLTPIAMASFVSLFIKTDIVKKMGLPIKEFFIWSDDWEYTRRISRKYKCYFVANSVVTHKLKSNIGANIAEENGDKLNKFKYLYRNDVVLYRREGIIGKISMFFREILHIYRILKSNLKDKKQRIKIIIDSVNKGKRFYPKIEKIL